MRNGMGMPCLGAEYTDSASDRHRLLEGAVCPVCGRPATDCHHQPPKGMGGGSGSTAVVGLDGAGHLLRPGLVGLCRRCHIDRIHSRGELAVRWRWDSDQLRWLYEGGNFAPEMYEQPWRLYEIGCWEFTTNGEAFTVRLDPDGNAERKAT